MDSNFVDYVKIYCRSGKGGRGSMHLRHVKYQPNGGPDGGDGGNGGSIYLTTSGHCFTWNISVISMQNMAVTVGVTNVMALTGKTHISTCLVALWSIMQRQVSMYVTSLMTARKCSCWKEDAEVWAIFNFVRPPIRLPAMLNPVNLWRKWPLSWSWNSLPMSDLWAFQTQGNQRCCRLFRVPDQRLPTILSPRLNLRWALWAIATASHSSWPTFQVSSKEPVKARDLVCVSCDISNATPCYCSWFQATQTTSRKNMRCCSTNFASSTPRC